LDIGSTAAPEEWFDSSIVREALDDMGSQLAPTDKAPLGSLDRVRAFLAGNLVVLSDLFGRTKYQDTRVKLQVLEQLSRVRRFRG
jgi:hypothetical protein